MTVIDAGNLDGGELDEEHAAGHVHGISLKTGPPRRVGVELEWLVRDARDPALPVAAGRIAAAISVFDAAEQDTARGATGDYRESTGDYRENQSAGGVRADLPTSSSPGVLPSGA